MRYMTHYQEHVGGDPTRWFKTTLFQSQNLLLGMDCLEVGQQQPAHRHAGRDKFYYVIAGTAQFSVNGETAPAGPGAVVWAPADSEHAVVNTGTERLVLLIGIAPEPN